MQNAQGGVGKATESSVGGLVQEPRTDFAKIHKDFASLGWKPFSGMESMTKVQEWMKSRERIFGDLELEDT